VGRLIALDPVCVDLAERAGLRCDRPGDDVDLSDVDVVFAAGVEGLARAQEWRRQGHRFALALRSIADADEPHERHALEPLALLRDATPDALRAAVASVEPGAALPRLVLEHGVADLAARRFTSADAVVELSELQCRLLAYLAERAGRGVSREELQVQVWGHRTALNTRAVDMAVSRLRKKIEAKADSPASLLTAQGGGYRLVLREAVPSRLPRPTDSFRGRAELLGRLRARLDAGVPAVVLTGPPGVGKSRLALELAHSVGGPAARVDAAELTELNALITAVAATVGVPAATEGTPAERCAALAGSASMLNPRLLLLDHVETLGPAIAPLIDAFATQAPGWRLVLACHAAPPVRAEVVSLPPLPLNDAAALFRERARASGGDPGNATALLPLLDGLPLAIELAAARTRALPVTELAAVLQRRRDLLAKPRGADDRHRSLADAVAEAAGRAPPDLQADLVRLASFEASFDLDAATAVLGDDAAFRLVGLVEDSLLQREGDRWRLLHAIRAWARDAGSDDDRAAAASAHLSWAAALAARHAAAADGFEGREATRILAAHSADLLAAWDRAELEGNPRALVALTRGLDALWIAHGTEEQRRQITDRAVQALRDTPSEAAALLLWATARFHAERTACRDALTRARACLDDHPDPSLAASVTWRLGVVRARLEGYAAALQTYADAPSIEGAAPAAALEFDIYRTQVRTLAGELTADEAIAAFTGQVERAVLLGALNPGVTAGRFAALRMQHRGDLEGAMAIRSRLFAWREHFADRRVEGVLAVEMAYDRYGRHEFDEALTWFDRALDVIAVAEPVRRYPVLLYRGLVLLHLQRHAEARLAVDEFLGWSRATESLNDEVGALGLLSLVHLDQGDPVLAESVARQSVALADKLGNEWEANLSRLQLADALRLLGRIDEARATFAEVDPTKLARAQQSEAWVRMLCLGPDPTIQAAFESQLPGAVFIGGPTWVEIAAALRLPRPEREPILRRLTTAAPTAQGRLVAAGLLTGWVDAP